MPQTWRNAMHLASFIEEWIGSDLPVRIRAYDGSDIGPRDAATTITVRSPRAVMRLIEAPGELGFARAYVAGDIEIDGDIYGALALRSAVTDLDLSLPRIWRLMRSIGVTNLRWVPPPREEFRPRGTMHSRSRDAEAISYHYDVSNEFYRLVLGESMTYSCAVFEHSTDTLEQAQANKYDLVCRKLGLTSGMRLLDIGCGWGGMAMHAATHYDAEVTAVTISGQQADLARRRVEEAGLEGQVVVHLMDYRDVGGGPYDAISSIGMSEHVGAKKLDAYFSHIHDLLVPGGLVLNHAISRDRPLGAGRIKRSAFMDRYVFPDGELHEVGKMISTMQANGLEVRNMESLREHYARTLRAWVANLESHWEEAVSQVGLGRARVWRLYMAVSAVGFEDNRIHVDQVLAARTPPDGRLGLPLRPVWNQRPVDASQDQ